MGRNIAEKIISAHLVSGEMTVGSDIGLKIDQTLTQDATGTMAYLEFEAMGVPRVKTERSVAYIDHNTLQNGFENADDHRFIRTVAKTTIDLFRALQKNTASIFPARATASAIRFTLNGSEFPERPLSVRTVTPPPAAVSECLPWVPAEWMLRSPWAEENII